MPEAPEPAPRELVAHEPPQVAVRVPQVAMRSRPYGRMSFEYRLTSPLFDFQGRSTDAGPQSKRVSGNAPIVVPLRSAEPVAKIPLSLR